MTTSRVSTSARAIITRAAIQAVEPVMWCAAENRAMAGPAPLPAAMAKASRAPTPPIHMLAGRTPARPGGRPRAPGRVLRAPPADGAHRRAGRHGRRLQRQVAAAGRDGV